MAEKLTEPFVNSCCHQKMTTLKFFVLNLETCKKKIPAGFPLKATYFAVRNIKSKLDYCFCSCTKFTYQVVTQLLPCQTLPVSRIRCGCWD